MIKSPVEYIHKYLNINLFCMICPWRISKNSIVNQTFPISFRMKKIGVIGNLYDAKGIWIAKQLEVRYFWKFVPRKFDTSYLW
jgi:hypothetical protein